MPHTRRYEHSFGDMKVSLESWTQMSPQKVVFEITGTADTAKAKAAYEQEGSVISTDRLIQPKYREAVNLIRTEMEKIGKASECENVNHHGMGVVRHSFMVPKIKIMLSALRSGPEYKDAETRNTKVVFDAMQKRLEDIAPQVEELLARNEDKGGPDGNKPVFLKDILEEPELRRERLKRDITMIAPEVAAHNIDPLVSYVEAEINAAAAKRTVPSFN